MASLTCLPSEIWFEIQTRIKSLESLGRCRLVSKDWNRITYDSSFWKLFCERSDTVSGFLIQSLYHGNRSSTFVSVDNKANKKLKLSILDFLPVPVKIEAVSQGLVFCVSQNYSRVPEYFVCKPTTLQWESLPNPKTRYFTRQTAMVVLSSKPLRYKIIRLSELNSPVVKYKSQLYNNLRCEVFDSNTWAWKRLRDVSLPYSVFLGSNRPCVTSCGACYWLLTNNQVFAFYCEDYKESWEIFDLPQLVSEGDCFNSNRLLEYQGRLALIHYEREFMDLWVMEDLERKVWSKRQALISFKVLRGHEGYTTPPVALYNSDIALMEGYKTVYFYKFQDSRCNVVRLEDRPDQIFKLQSDFEKVNLRGPWRWQDFSFIFFLFAFNYLFRYFLGLKPFFICFIRTML